MYGELSEAKRDDTGQDHFRLESYTVDLIHRAVHVTFSLGGESAEGGTFNPALAYSRLSATISGEGIERLAESDFSCTSIVNYLRAAGVL